jgi:AmpE protein
MTFIITLFALIIERFFHWNQLRYWRWFGGYQRWLSHSRINQLPSWVLYAISVLPPILLIGLINCSLVGWFYGIFKLIFGIVILVYCLGPVNLWLQTYRCLSQLHQADSNAAVLFVQKEFAIGVVENSQAFHQAFIRAIFQAAYQRVFAVIFWFVVLGPIGAVLYRLTALICAESPLGLTQVAKKIQQWLDWIPVRILTFIFALGGHYTEVFNCWKKNVVKGPEMNEALLAECGVAALDIMKGDAIVEEGAAEKEAISLLDRVFVMSLVILAVGVLLVQI